MRKVKYPSPVGALFGWYAAPEAASKARKVPAVLYAHGGFAFGSGDYEAARPFLEGGAAIFVPTWRGENGNPGHYELFWGELEDLRAAVRWLAAQPEVDKDRIYVFGHSAGGVLAGLLSLTDAPVQKTGSAGGLYDEVFFSVGEKDVFDSTVAEARALRVLPPHVSGLRIPHVAYIGRQDPLAATGAHTALSNEPAPGKLEVLLVPGDHGAMLRPAVLAFGARIGLDMEKGPKAEPATLGDLTPGVPKRLMSSSLVELLCQVETCMGQARPNCREHQQKVYEACADQLIPGLEKIPFEKAQGFFGEASVCMAQRLEDPGGKAQVCLLRGLAELARGDGEEPEPSEPAWERRKGFQTLLIDKVRSSDPVAKPPSSVFRVVEYPTELGPMKAWLGVRAAKDRRPAIVWITGGFPPGGVGPSAWQAPDLENEQTAQAYRHAGFVMMYPTFRGSFGNPGYREYFLGEADDALAAIRFLKKQPGVDPDRVYIGGHSTGGTLALIAGALAGDEVAGIISLGPVADPQVYREVPYDTSRRDEHALRKPVLYLEALRAPTLLIEGAYGNSDSARRFRGYPGADNLEIIIVDGADHFDYLGAAHRQIAERLIKTGKLGFSVEELEKP